MKLLTWHKKFRASKKRSGLILLCQILSEHSSLNCSVVIHHTTA
jgi:hypothetical protein